MAYFFASSSCDDLESADDLGFVSIFKSKTGKIVSGYGNKSFGVLVRKVVIAGRSAFVELCVKMRLLAMLGPCTGVYIRECKLIESVLQHVDGLEFFVEIFVDKVETGGIGLLVPDASSNGSFDDLANGLKIFFPGERFFLQHHHAVLIVRMSVPVWLLENGSTDVFPCLIDEWYVLARRIFETAKQDSQSASRVVFHKKGMDDLLDGRHL